MDDTTLQPLACTQDWDTLARCVDGFSRAWHEGTPPLLADHAPPGPPHLRHLVLVELIKVDLEQRWGGGREPWLLEEYGQQAPEIAPDGEYPVDLIYEEYHIRRQAGFAVDPHQYFERFPRQAKVLARLLGIEAPHLSTTLIVGERPEEINAGEKIDDFELIARLGKGAFATVWKARQLSMQRYVAVKISADHGVEPQTMGQLEHDHIVRVFDQRVIPERRTRLLYMQYIPGGTLQAVVELAAKTPPAARGGKTLLAAIDKALDERGELRPVESPQRARLARMSWSEVVCRLGSKLAAALHYAHGRTTLHRDVKPANVLLDAEGNPKLVDFNVSYCAGVEGVSAAAYFGGSLAYMSPEQLAACRNSEDASAEALDGRSDVYSLGIVLWELLTGTRPFVDQVSEKGFAATLSEMHERRLAGVPEAARRLLPADCLPGLEQVLTRALAPHCDDRFAHAGEFARQLELCLQPRAQRLMRPRPGGWRAWARRHPLWGAVAVGLPANLTMSLINIVFNQETLVKRYFSPEVVQHFQTVQVPVVNATLFPVAIFLVLSRMGQIARRMREAGGPRAAEEIRQFAWWTLTYGDLIALIGMLGWMIASVVFPVWLQYRSGEFQPVVFLHYVGSQFLCGLIAAALSFFCVTCYMLRVIYPVGVPLGAPDPQIAGWLAQLSRRAQWYFSATAASPFLAMFMLVAIQSDVRMFFAGLGVLGLVGFFLGYRLNQTIQDDLSVLIAATDPGRDAFGVGSTVGDTVGTSSRW